jgi:hypothetical protein
MKAFLLHPGRDFAVKGDAPALWLILRRDLQLDILIAAMAHGGARVAQVVERALMLSPANDARMVRSRQAALRDCLRNPDAVRSHYDLAQEPLGRQTRVGAISATIRAAGSITQWRRWTVPSTCCTA